MKIESPSRGFMEGMRVLVTGASSQIGRAICAAFEARGATVVRHAHTSPADVNADLSTEAGVAALLAAAGEVDVLVNNASIFSRIPLDALTAADVDAMNAVHIRAPALLIQGLASSLCAVVNIVDNASGRGDWPHHAHYCAAKAGLLSLTRSLAAELAPRVRINAVGPGAIAFKEWESAERRASVEAQIPMGRLGTPEEVAAAVLFLAGPDASYITGTVLDVAGGWQQ